MRYRISENLILEVVARFEDWHPRIGVDPEPILTFPAAHPEVGEARVWDDLDEARIEIGAIAHGHFGSYDDSLTEQEHAEHITRAVVEFLEALFQDRVVLWKGPAGSGGWRVVSVKRSYDRRWLPVGRTYVWSQPFQPTVSKRRPAG